MMRTPLDAAYGDMTLWAFVAIGALVFGTLWYRYKFHAFWGIVTVALVGVIVEYVALSTCFPYGCFEYSSLIGPTLMDVVPYSLLVIWPLLVISVIQFVPEFTAEVRLIASFVGGCFLTLFDFLLDPVSVQQGLWGYSEAVRYGVPMSNFA